MQKISQMKFKSPLGVIIIAELDGKIIKISLNNPEGIEMSGWLDRKFPRIDREDLTNSPNKILTEAKEQIIEYLQGKRSVFSFPYELIGTEFQKAVWQRIAEVPIGEVRTYGDVAAGAGNPAAARAVGGACNKNPLPLLIPCHRIVGSGGGLVGFGCGIKMKEKLLDLEKNR